MLLSSCLFAQSPRSRLVTLEKRPERVLRSDTFRVMTFRTGEISPAQQRLLPRFLGAGLLVSSSSVEGSSTASGIEGGLLWR